MVIYVYSRQTKRKRNEEMKIKMKNPIVEMNGDEMTAVIWSMIKEHLIEPFIDLKSEYYDLSLENRDRTDDKVTVEAANAILQHKVGVKCATITPNTQRMEEYNLKKLWASPNATIRAIMDGTVFRAPVMVDGIKPLVSGWEKPIIVARHAYGDVYKGVELLTEDTTAYLKTDQQEKLIFKFDGKGIVQAIHNTDRSIKSFAKSCFEFALSTKQDLWFSTKDTISKVYDHRFKDIFRIMYEDEYKEKFEEAGIEYFYTLIDDAVARVMRSKGGFIWALKNYDGDVMSDMIATVFGSLAMMTSVLVSPQGAYEYEAAHGTVTRHYYKYRNNEETSTNSIATIFAWSGALRKRAELDENKKLEEFANKLEKAAIETIESGYMTKDLINMFHKDGVEKHAMNTEEFLIKIAEKL